jgi:hypothetical protein
MRHFVAGQCFAPDEQGRTRVFVEAYRWYSANGLFTSRRRKPAENAAHREKGHLWMETNLNGLRLKGKSLYLVLPVLHVDGNEDPDSQQRRQGEFLIWQ